jgi:hypothetical protein
MSDKKSGLINVSGELNELYKKQRERLDALLTREIEKNMPLKDTTDNVAVTMKMLELIHTIQSEKNLEDAIDNKNAAITNIMNKIEEEEEEAEEEKEPVG